MKRESPAKKHHFWILFGVVPLFTLIAVIVVNAKVGGEISKRQDDIKAANDDIAKKNNPKSEDLLRKLGEVALKVDKKQDVLHKDNWEKQKALFTWPGNSPVFKSLEERELKFGAPLTDLTAVFNEFQNVDTYQREFSTLKTGETRGGTGMADRMAPTQFLGGWKNVLRYVNDFGQVVASKEQVWLVLEDMWVQRSLLDGVRSVNEEMARFDRVKLEKDKVVIDDPADQKKQNKNHRLFRNRIWELELELVQEGGASYRLAGTLTNISDRLQLMGNSNTMTLKVWLSNDPAAEPKVFKIGGEFLPGRGAMKTIKDKDGNTQTVKANVQPVNPLPDHVLSGNIPTDLEIVRVEQVFDVRTVPVKRIDALVMGKLDSRNQGQPLLPPLGTSEGGLFADSYVKDPVAADPGMGMDMGMGMGMGGPGPGGVAGVPGAGGMGGPNDPSAVAGRQAGGGPLLAVTDGNKKRYLARTPQVRRMPVGLVVVVDQSYLQDVLLALSNSPLRFQITQVAWTRYRGTLDGAGTDGGGVGSGSDGVPAGPRGTVGGGLGGSGDPDARRMPAIGPIAPGIGTQPGSGSPSPGPGPMGPMGSGPGPMGYPGSSGGGPSIASDSQITSGLVELSVYGVVSVYEKYEAAKPADKAADAPGGMPPAPGGMPPAPAMPPVGTTPKMRRGRK